MKKYCKINKNNEIEVFTGSDINSAKKAGFVELDVEQSEVDSNWYLAEKCPHYTEEELAQKEKDKRKAEIKTKFYELDVEAVRPLRAEIAGTATDEDIQKLKDIEEQAVALRIELQNLNL